MKYPTNYCVFDLCRRTGDELKRIGFAHHYTSMKTEASYYRWPDRPHLLRVAAHKMDRKRNFDSRYPIATTITFRGTHRDPAGMINIGEAKIESVIAQAVGRYFMKSAEGWPDPGRILARAIEDAKE